jgi:hypothetical protein
MFRSYRSSKVMKNKHQTRLSVRIGSLAMLLCAVAVIIVFTDGRDNSPKEVGQAGKVSEVASNGIIVLTNLQVVPSFGK